MDFGVTHVRHLYKNLIQVKSVDNMLCLYFGQDCVIAPCSNETHPGFWDVPMVALQSGENGSVCSMADSCLS